MGVETGTVGLRGAARKRARADGVAKRWRRRGRIAWRSAGGVADGLHKKRQRGGPVALWGMRWGSAGAGSAQFGAEAVFEGVEDGLATDEPVEPEQAQPVESEADEAEEAQEAIEAAAASVLLFHIPSSASDNVRYPVFCITAEIRLRPTQALSSLCYSFRRTDILLCCIYRS